MSITDVNATPSSAVYDAINAANTAKTAGTTAAASGEQDRFLKLLTAQLKNQDPLNPLDNAQMTSQLAQISTVDGIAKLNATLQTMLDNSTTSQSLAAAALVGHGVLVPGSGLSLQQGVAVGGVDLSGPADAVTATIKDANGLTVRTLQLGAMTAGAHSFNWDGNAENGTPAADGAYTVSLAAKQGQDAVTANALQVGMVASVMNSSQGVSLNVGSLGTFKMSDVKEII